MANQFFGDSSCYALWDIGPSLLSDYQRSNTMTATGSPATVNADCKAGSNSVAYAAASSQAQYRTDTNLGVGYPLKNADAIGIITVCEWFKVTTWTDGVPIYAKWDTNNLRSLMIALSTTGGNCIGLHIGYTGGTLDETIPILTTPALQTGRWYHIGVTYVVSTKAYTARLWDDTLGTIQIAGGNSTNTMTVSTGGVSLGSLLATGSPATFYNGLLNEVAVFNRVLRAEEIDAVRCGTFGGIATKAGLSRFNSSVFKAANRSLHIRRPSMLKQHK
jgi:hypothetical protein